jgi:type III pantothenate kinase
VTRGWRVAADLGNSALKLFAVDATPSTERNLQRVSLAEIDWPDAIADALRAFGVPKNAPALWSIASVNRPASDRMKAWLHRHRRHDQIRMVTWEDIDLEIDVQYPERVGIDRLVASWAGFLYAKRAPVIVVDAGSAMTVDLVDQRGVFRGGAILPGLRLQIRSLAAGTDALTEIELGPPLPAPITAGKNTEQAIRFGVHAAAAGGIEFLQSQYRKMVTSVPRLIVTGGDAGHLAAILPNAEIVPNLILQGLLQLASQEPVRPEGLQ